MKTLLISNSTNAGEAYLGWVKDTIIDYCSKHNVKRALFVPYAGVNVGQDFEGKTIKDSYDLYFERVKGVLQNENLTIEMISEQPLKDVENAECIIVGGGNTFHLVAALHELNLMEAISKKVKEGMPYIGWSAGANIACPTMKTTNDMPIIEPKSFNTLNLVPFQINPHYLDANPAGHGGETREDRIREFLVVNPAITVVGLREATAFLIEGNKISLIGDRKLRVFRYKREAEELSAGDDLQFLLATP